MSMVDDLYMKKKPEKNKMINFISKNVIIFIHTGGVGWGG